MKKRLFLVVLGMVGLVLSLPKESVFAGGFQNPAQGASASGQAGAFVAQADDPTALTHNPAGLTQISGTNFLFSPTIINPSTKYLTGTGETYKIKEETHLLPNLYFVTDFKREDWRFGLGITTPYGQATEWSKDSPFRYYATRSEMKFIDINPSLAYRVSNALSVGIGLNYYYSNIILEALDDYSLYGPFPDGNHQIDVDGNQWGYNVGVLYKPSEKQSIGGSFRSGISVKHRGELKMVDVPDPLGGPAITVPAVLKLDFPHLLSLGYAYRPNKRWKVEFDVEWVGWSAVDTIPVTLVGMADQKIVKDWNDTISYRLGMELRTSSQWRLWAGYLFLPTPVPDRTFEPSLPDTDTHIFCLGLEWKKERFSLALSQELSFPEERNISEGGLFDGVYKSFNAITTLNLQYNF